MPTTLDGAPIHMPVECDEPLREYILRVGQECAAGRMIVLVKVDGVELVEDELAERLVCPLAGDEAIDLESATPQEVAGGALRVIASSLRSAGDALPGLADLSEGDSRRGEALSGYLEVWRNCQEAINGVAELLARDVGSLTAEDGALVDHMPELADRLRELRDAFLAGDAVLLNDLLRYDWPDLSRLWADRLESVAGEISA